LKFKIPTVSERFEHVIKNAIATGITKSVGIVTNLAMVPLTVGYLGSEQYGLWMAISSLIAILQLMDMGIGNALISMVAHSKNGKTDLSIKTL
jgi:O-antigen/teichoic acid export membrane protein